MKDYEERVINDVPYYWHPEYGWCAKSFKKFAEIYPIIGDNKIGDIMVNLGDEVQDMVSGFKGIAVSRHSYLQGCDRISIQPPINKDNELIDSESFDEPQLKILKTKKVKQGQRITGGPEKYSDTPKSIK